MLSIKDLERAVVSERLQADAVVLRNRASTFQQRANPELSQSLSPRAAGPARSTIECKAETEATTVRRQQTVAPPFPQRHKLERFITLCLWLARPFLCMLVLQEPASAASGIHQALLSSLEEHAAARSELERERASLEQRLTVARVALNRSEGAVRLQELALLESHKA